MTHNKPYISGKRVFVKIMLIFIYAVILETEPFVFIDGFISITRMVGIWIQLIIIISKHAMSISV